MPPALADDCFLHDRDRLRHDEALALLKARIAPLADVEPVPLEAACGRVLAEDIGAPRPVPAFDNAAVDGYAFAHADYLAAGGTLPVSDRIAAGHPADKPLDAGTAARIFTGAPMPSGADTVAMQEDVALADADGRETVRIPAGMKPGANRRRAGEDLKAGDVLAAAAQRLRPQDVAAIASTGRPEVSCHRRLRVALVSSGDEIIRPGTPLGRGQVYDANIYMLRALLDGLGVEIDDLGILGDEAATVRAALADAARGHDAILTTGGVSRGEEDHMVDAVAALGNLHMWQLAIKPGRPLSFGQIGDCLYLGLPGNPVAAMVCFLLYVRPVLLARAGGDWPTPRRYWLPAGFAMSKKIDRREFLRGMVVDGPDGRPHVDKFERDGSGLISSLRAADGLIELDEETCEVEPGTPVAFVPFAELGVAPR